MMKRVLLADDDADDAEVFKEALEKVCDTADCTWVENGKKLFLYLEKVSTLPEVIFLDVNMPEMNGWQCLAKLKNSSEYKSIPVIMYTTSSSPRDRQIAQDMNAHGLITKPSNHKVLEKILDLVVCNLGKEELIDALKDAYLIAKES